jgi:hypothetical protein
VSCVTGRVGRMRPVSVGSLTTTLEILMLSGLLDDVLTIIW